MSFLLLLDYTLILFIIVLFNIIFIDKDNIASNDGIIIEYRIRKGIEGSDCRIIQGNKFSIFLKELRKSRKRLRIPEPRDLIHIKGTTNHLTVMFNTELSPDTVWSIPAPS